jgi:hypothetical protein
MVFTISLLDYQYTIYSGENSLYLDYIYQFIDLVKDKKEMNNKIK